MNLNWGLEDPTGKIDAEFLKVIKAIEEKILELRGLVVSSNVL